MSSHVWNVPKTDSAEDMEARGNIGTFKSNFWGNSKMFLLLFHCVNDDITKHVYVAYDFLGMN